MKGRISTLDGSGVIRIRVLFTSNVFGFIKQIKNAAKKLRSKEQEKKEYKNICLKEAITRNYIIGCL
jgi:hypothetical protein